jgi:hypothetical protein
VLAYYMLVFPQNGKDTYNPCYIWDVDYSAATFSGHSNASRACVQWQFDSTESGETITEKVRALRRTDRRKTNV